MKKTMILILLICLFLTSCPNTTDEEYFNPWYPTDTYQIAGYPCLIKKTGIPFKIIQLADTQLNDNIRDGDEQRIVNTFSVITDTIESNSPDMLVLTGDNVSGENNDILGKRLIEFLDSFAIPHALVMGNHDGEGRFDNKNMGQVFARGRYSLFTNGPDNIHGTGNYAVNIKNEDNQLLYSLIMLDSNRYRKYDTRDGYDYIYPEQIAWYEWIIKGAAKAAGVSSIPSLAFFHIPLPEINDIKAKMTLENQVEAESAFRETPCPPEINTGLFSRMKDIGSTKAIFFGHDHVNLLNYTYQGIHFVYGLKTGYCSYYDNDRIGTTLITINDDSTIDVQFKYYVSE